jgi:hypothetical protein
MMGRGISGHARFAEIGNPEAFGAVCCGPVSARAANRTLAFAAQSGIESAQ